MQDMMLIGIDVGTTHIKAGLFHENGDIYSYAFRSNPARLEEEGAYFYDPEEIYHLVCSVISEVASGTDPRSIEAIGIASMAETGLLVEKETGYHRSPFIPWFDTTADSEVSSISNSFPPDEQFKRTGIRPSFKCALAKVLRLKTQNEHILENAIWLGVADYIASRLSGCVKTDYSLAGRTHAFRINEKVWDTKILEIHGLNASMFPPAFPSGSVVGFLLETSAKEMGLLPGIPISISGHDHVCATFGVRVSMGDKFSELIVDSMGTAEALTGSINERILGNQEHDSGFSYGCDVRPGRFYWMGGLSASGASVEWFRKIMGDFAATYKSVENLLAEADEKPTGIIYFPYLSGSGAPHSNTNVRAAFLGLDIRHSQKDILKAVLEGTAYEIEFIRRRAAHSLKVNVDEIAVVGGGTKNRNWLQIKADVFGCPLLIPDIREATILGAALLAALGSGIYKSENDMLGKVKPVNWWTIYPDEARHKIFNEIYEQKYLRFQDAVRGINWVEGNDVSF
ncbi:MAG: carbohydrate kinase [Anaerolineales bacterium]|nr:carbohydrate kinase [Anaerolineales bacterium]